MKYLISLLFIFISLILSAQDQSFTKSEELKQEKFQYPSLLINTEIGQRYAFEPLDDLMQDDFEIIDSYNFKQGYFKLMQQVSKTARADISYSFDSKDYDLDKELNNRSGTFSFGMLYQVLPSLSADLIMNYREKKFMNNDSKDNTAFSPSLEMKLRPGEKVLLGMKYVFLRSDYFDNNKNSDGNRVLLYWEESFYDGNLKLRLRYRGENRDYAYPSPERKSSSKHGLSFSAAIDFN